MSKELVETLQDTFGPNFESLWVIAIFFAAGLMTKIRNVIKTGRT